MSQKIKDILETLETGVKDLLSSDNYRDYLRYMSTFPSYSYRNSLLIYLQCRQQNFVPSLLAPYREWQKRHRHVKAGQHGIAIIAPHYYKTPKPDGTEEDKLGFHLAHTFDVSQTEPDDAEGEIPEICHRLTGSLPDENLLDVITSISPVPVKFEPIPGETNGYYSSSECEIAVDNTNAPLQQVKTLLHELGHCWHRMLVDNFDECPRNEREIIAESVAYTVCMSLAVPIDPSEYSFGYLVSYSQSHHEYDLSAFHANLNLIQKISNQILSDIDAATIETKPETN